MRIKTAELRLKSLNTFSKKRAFRRALYLFEQASHRVPAYKEFLRKHKIKSEKITTEADFEKLPLPDKVNYISQYSLNELSWDGNVASTNKYISTSSGSSGVPYFWPRGHAQEITAGFLYQQIFEKIFRTKEGSSLCVDSYALGTWIAGLELYNATKWTADRGNKIIIVTPGIDRGEAINQIRRLASDFKRVILAGYPPFVKDIIDFGTASGISWKNMDIYLLTAGEAVSEKWRDRVLQMIGKSGDFSRLINVYGMSESGVVAHETPVSIHLRRVLSKIKDGQIDASKISGLYQYYPSMQYFEVVPDEYNSIVLTSNAGLPLIRYNTRDCGGIIDHSTALTIVEKRDRSELEKWQLPFIYLYGRKDLSLTFYALNIYVENIKRVFEKALFSSKLSGLFIMSVELAENLDQRFEITVELARGENGSAAFGKDIAKYVIRELCSINSEYARLYQAIGTKAMPKIRLVPYGKIDTVPGRKHKWVRRK